MGQTYIGKPPAIAFGLEEVDNIIYDVTADGTVSYYDIPVPTEDAAEFVYDFRIEHKYNGSAPAQLYLYQGGDTTAANYLTLYRHGSAGAAPAGAVDAASYLTRASTGGLYSYWGIISLRGGNFRWNSWGNSFVSSAVTDNFYSGTYNGSGISSISTLRIGQGAGNIPDGVRILITRREVSALKLTPVSPQKNILFNSDFAINQRGYVSGTTLAGLTYGLDRWRGHGSSGSQHTISGITCTIDNATASTDGYLVQPIEENTLVAGEYYTLSWEGDAEASVYYANGSTESYQSSPLTFLAPSGATASVQEIILFRGDGVTVRKPKLERGRVATPWEKPEPTTEGMRCMRFYERHKAGAVYSRFGVSYAVSTTQSDAVVHYKVAKRATPTFGYSNLSHLGFHINNNIRTPSAVVDNGSDTKTATLRGTYTAIGAAGDAGGFLANNTTSAWIEFDAEI